jgi:hypothetical protein
LERNHDRFLGTIPGSWRCPLNICHYHCRGQ